MGELTSIDVPKLHQVGNAVQEVTTRLATIQKQLYVMEYHSDGAVEGSLTSESSLGAAAMSWGYTIEKLGRDVGEYAAGLHRAADDYQHADEHAQAHLDAVGGY
jgi:hypothetical protein